MRERMTIMLAILVLLAAGCSTAAPAPTTTPTATASPTATGTSTPPPVTTEKVTFVSSDGVALYGTLYPGGGDLAVVLAHQGAGQTTQASWATFAGLAAEKGITALPFNFRRDFTGPLDLDVVAAIHLLRERGYKRIACIGASMGGTSCLKAGLTEELAGIGVIGSNWSTGGGVSIDASDLATLTVPKLFVTVDNDRFAGITAVMRSMYKQAPEPKQFQEYAGTAHGTEIFSTPSRDEFRKLLLDFLAGL